LPINTRSIAFIVIESENDKLSKAKTPTKAIRNQFVVVEQPDEAADDEKSRLFSRDLKPCSRQFVGGKRASERYYFNTAPPSVQVRDSQI